MKRVIGIISFDILLSKSHRLATMRAIDPKDERHRQLSCDAAKNISTHKSILYTPRRVVLLHIIFIISMFWIKKNMLRKHDLQEGVLNPARRTFIFQKVAHHWYWRIPLPPDEPSDNPERGTYCPTLWFTRRLRSDPPAAEPLKQTQLPRINIDGMDSTNWLPSAWLHASSLVWKKQPRKQPPQKPHREKRESTRKSTASRRQHALLMKGLFMVCTINQREWYHTITSLEARKTNIQLCFLQPEQPS